MKDINFFVQSFVCLVQLIESLVKLTHLVSLSRSHKTLRLCNIDFFFEISLKKKKKNYLNIYMMKFLFLLYREC